VIAIGIAALTASGALPAPAGAADVPLAGRVAVAKPGKAVRVVLDPPPALPSAVVGGRLRLADAGSGGSQVVMELNGAWQGLGSPPGSKGFRYRGTGEANDPCLAVMKRRVVKVVCRGLDVAPPLPLQGELSAVLELGSDRYCAAFAGENVRNDAGGLKRIEAPAPTTCPVITPTCREMLGLLGIDWSDGPALQGIADPVTVTFPLNGIDYYFAGSTNPTASAAMDCQLALALHRMADDLPPNGITAVEYFGIYAYRVIAGSNTLSQHAKGLAIDVAAFRGTAGAVYDVESDWEIDGGSTCPPATAPEANRILHELVCGWHADAVFDVILTPNYNASQRNHFSLDLQPGSHFIQ
jgi:hypothetical protein